MSVCCVHAGAFSFKDNVFKSWPWIIEARPLWSVLWCGTQNNKKGLWAPELRGDVCVLYNQISSSKLLCHWSKQSEKTKWRSLRVVTPSLWSLSFQSARTTAKALKWALQHMYRTRAPTMDSQCFPAPLWKEFNIKKMNRVSIRQLYISFQLILEEPTAWIWRQSVNLDSQLF